VWEDVVDGSEGDHDQGEGGAGGVEPEHLVVLRSRGSAPSGEDVQEITP
jgi:hypothetical protein